METQQLLVRIRSDVADALDEYKSRTRIPKSATVEEALRDYFHERGIELETPAHGK